MPIHAWSKTDAGLFHHFHQSWMVHLCDGLNALLPSTYVALCDRRYVGSIPESETGSEFDAYALRADRIAIRRRMRELVAVIEIVSPGNKSSKAAIRAFLDKAVQFLRQGVHLLIIDLFPPTSRDPQGLHPLIWDEILEEPFELPRGKPLTLAAYSAGPVKVACVEPVAVGDVLPEMPLFLVPEQYVSAPLEPTYQQTWDDCPAAFKEAVMEDARK